MSHRSAWVALVLLAASNAAWAQDITSRVPPDAAVELTTLGLIESRLAGRLRTIDSSGIRFTVTRLGSAAFIPWTNVQSLRWTPARSHRRGALDGALTGLLIGGSLYLNSQPWTARTVAEKESSRRIAVGAAGVFLAMTAIGAAVGSHHWQGVPLPRGDSGSVELVFHPEDEVRVESTLGRFVGRRALASDSLRFVSSSGPMTFAWRTVGDLQIRGTSRRWWGALYGFGGTLALHMLAEAFVDISEGERFTQLLAGGAFGYFLLAPRHWQSLPQPSR